MLKWLIYGVIIVGVLITIVAVIGTFLPKTHRASRTVTYPATSSKIYSVITDVARFPEWRSDIEGVELLAEDGKGMRFREKGSQGIVTYRVVVQHPDTELVTRIDDASLPFGGSWTFEIKPQAEGSSLTITEDGEIYNPIFRVLAKFFFSPFATIDRYQADLGRRLTR